MTKLRNLFFATLFALATLGAPAADLEISALGASPGVAAGDLFPCTDISDTTASVNGTTKKCTAAQVQAFALGNAFTQFTGPTTSAKTFTLPNASATVLTTNAPVTAAQGGTGNTTYTDGQLLIGNTATGGLSKATLTAGSNVTITNGNGTISIASTGGGGGFTPTDYITGLIVTKHTAANTLDVSAGAAYVPAGSAVSSCATPISGNSAGTLGASQWNQVYLNADCTITVVNNADPTSTTYIGTARKDGSDRRWLGAFRTDGSSNIINIQALESARNQLLITPKAAVNAAPYRVLTAGTATTYGAETSMATAVPRYATTDVLFNNVAAYTVGVGPLFTTLSIDGVNDGTVLGLYTDTGFGRASAWAAIEPSLPGIYYIVGVGGTGTGPTTYLDVASYKYTR